MNALQETLAEILPSLQLSAAYRVTGPLLQKV